MKSNRITTHWIGIFILLCLSSHFLAADSIESTKLMLEKWLETQKIISQEKKDWLLSREMLNGRIELLKQEIADQKQKIDDLKKNIDEAGAARLELANENELLNSALGSLEAVLGTLEVQTRNLIPRLPDPLQERIKPLSQRLPQPLPQESSENRNEPPKSEQSNPSISERFQNVVGILNELDKFNRDIFVTSELRTMEDGNAAEVTSIYLGLGQAYYSQTSGKLAGMAAASENGWIWKPAPAYSETVSQAIAIYNNEQMAAFVHLPVDFQSLGPLSP